MKLQFAQVDVFTSKPFMGNPVAVVFDADILMIHKCNKLQNGPTYQKQHLYNLH